MYNYNFTISNISCNMPSVNKFLEKAKETIGRWVDPSYLDVLEPIAAPGIAAVTMGLSLAFFGAASYKNFKDLFWHRHDGSCQVIIA